MLSDIYSGQLCVEPIINEVINAAKLQLHIVQSVLHGKKCCTGASCSKLIRFFKISNGNITNTLLFFV